MSAGNSLKKILTWTNMSIMVIALSATSQAIATQQTTRSDFGFGVYKAVQTELETTMSRQLGCLARNVYYESNGEPFRGQLAVAQVTVNRARSGMFPSDICAVVTQSTIKGDIKICQFSWVCDSRINKTRVIKKWETSYIAAKNILIDGKRIPNIGTNVLWFHSINIDPMWPHRVAATIGNHIFYGKDKKKD